MKLTAEMIRKSLEKGINNQSQQECIVSPNAYIMALRILEIEPTVNFCGELSIWLKAEELGLERLPNGSGG